MENYLILFFNLPFFIKIKNVLLERQFDWGGYLLKSNGGVYIEKSLIIYYLSYCNKFFFLDYCTNKYFMDCSLL